MSHPVNAYPNSTLPIVRVIRGLGQTMESAKEWTDLELLLRALRELGARPLLLSSPMKGSFYAYWGVLQQERWLYYDRLRMLVQDCASPQSILPTTTAIVILRWTLLLMSAPRDGSITAGRWTPFIMPKKSPTPAPSSPIMPARTRAGAGRPPESDTRLRRHSSRQWAGLHRRLGVGHHEARHAGLRRHL